MRHALFLPLAMLVASCAEQPVGQPAPVADARSQATVTVLVPPRRTVRGLTVALDDGARQWRWHVGELATVTPGQWRSPVVNVRSAGMLRMDFEWLDAAGKRVSAGEVSLPLKPDWVWGVDLHVAANDPTPTCMGCMGVRRFDLAPPVQASPDEAVFVTWGGNSISAPVVY